MVGGWGFISTHLFIYDNLAACGGREVPYISHRLRLRSRFPHIMSSRPRDIHSDEPYRWIPDDGSLVEPDVEFDSDDEELTTGDDPESDTHPHATDDERINPRGVFKQEVQRDPEICSSCFLKNYDVLFPHTERTSGPDGTVRYFVPADGTTESLPQAAQECQNPPRACECGRIGALRDRPLPKPRALEAAWNLSDTLARTGIEHNPLLLVATVQRRKSIPSYATQDDRNFDLAVARSLPSHSYEFEDYLIPRIDAPQLPPAE